MSWNSFIFFGSFLGAIYLIFIGFLILRESNSLPEKPEDKSKSMFTFFGAGAAHILVCVYIKVKEHREKKPDERSNLERLHGRRDIGNNEEYINLRRDDDHE
jgi:hypothetical protein